jgi:hypothetical protein
VTLLQIDLAFGDELEIICQGFSKVKTPPSSHGLQFPMLNIIVGCEVRFVNDLLKAKEII